MKFPTDLVIALIGRGVEYAAYAAVTYGCYLITPALGWIVGGILVLQATIRRPA